MEPTSVGFHGKHSRSIASAFASLVGARAALRDRLTVFLPKHSSGKNNWKFGCLQSEAIGWRR